MTTNIFKVTYANGKVQEHNSTAATAEELCGEIFGLTLEQAAEHGCSVELSGSVSEDRDELDVEEQRILDDANSAIKDLTDPGSDAVMTGTEASDFNLTTPK